MKFKSQIIGSLFLALVVILTLKPKIINNIYDNLLGRVFLICVIIFVSMNNVTLGLLVVLVIITALNQFFEGFEPNGQSVNRAVQMNLNNPNIIKEDGISSINLQDLRNTTMPKDSNTIQVDKNMNRSEEVDPSTSNMLNSNLKENFTLLGSNY